MQSQDAPLLHLAPSSARGWFGGRSLVARDALSVAVDVSLAEAGDALEAAFEGADCELVAVLADYDGACSVVRFGSACDVAQPSRRAASPALAPHRPPLLTSLDWDTDGRGYRAGVSDVRESIASGDVYVVNLTTRLRGTLSSGPEQAFETLVSRSGAEMNALLTGLPGSTSWIASVSPERFLRVERTPDGSRVVETQPIKGTRPRGLDPVEDAESADALLGDPKERAEHVMVVDLERNDLGRVCKPGSVRVEPLYEIVPTPYCHQLLSTVAGELRAEARFRDLLAATFPSGSVTGAPKLAAQVVIESLEASSRGAYCGALLVAIPGALDSSVLIRTLEGAADGSARWGTGCGVTFDSEPAAEWLELLLKTSPVLGDGLPDVALRETMRVVGGRLPLVDRHLARLAVGGCGASTLARVRSECSAALASADFGIHDPARLGVTVTPDGRVTAALSAAPSSIAVPGGPRVQTVTVPALPVLPAGAAKPADRSFWDRAHAAAIASGADQALLVTPEGVLVDGSTASVWLVIDGHLFTPPAPPAVAGVARELVFDIARELRIAAEEATLTVDDLASADEVFLSNAVGGVVPARGRGGPTTAAIAAEVEAAFARGDARGDQ